MACFAISWSLSLFFLFSLLICLANHIAVAQPEYVRSFCPDAETVAPSSQYQTNVDTVISFLLSNTTTWKITHDATAGNGANQVYGAYFCRIDQTSVFCQDCISSAINSFNEHCRGKRKSIVYYDQCLARYSDESFYGTMTGAPMIPYWNTRNSVNIQNITSNQTAFMQVLQGVLGVVSSEAANGTNQKFATKEDTFVGNSTSMNTIYTLAQCTPYISSSDCNTCLQMTIGNMTKLCNMKAGCTMMCPDCNIRYDINAFYGDALTPTSVPSSPPSSIDQSREGKPLSRQRIALIVGISISAVVILVGACLFLWKRKSKKSFTVKYSEPALVTEADEIETVESLKFDLTTIRKATNDFSADKKLGQGGFGEVYKGKLENGQYIAIKRLSINSKQGIDEFKTEVALVAKLQHRNLAKLLGFCLSGKEKILVYEFLPNMSLDRFLSDPTSRESLNWRTRFKIIGGIAKGLLYLHEDSRLRIVHRDLKPSNILLDEAMNPKIGDFGMAKLFGMDQTQDNTDRIVGTFGYMAPEYIAAGYFSVKSDVYSFGIIILELVSGLRNKYFCQEGNYESLLYRAWRLWNEGIPLKLTDPTFGDEYPVEEMTKCIHIGLLCIQEDAAKRPRMASIVGAFNGESITLPLPTPPLFLTGDRDKGIKDSSYQHTYASGVMDVTELHPR